LKQSTNREIPNSYILIKSVPTVQDGFRFIRQNLAIGVLEKVEGGTIQLLSMLLREKPAKAILKQVVPKPACEDRANVTHPY
jgi:hypothetical protein